MRTHFSQCLYRGGKGYSCIPPVTVKGKLDSCTRDFDFSRPDDTGDHPNDCLVFFIPYRSPAKTTSTWRLRNIHDKIGGKSEGEKCIHAEASNAHRVE